MANRCSNETDGTLDDICSQSNETVSLEAAQLETYVSTENLLPNKAGLQLSAGLPTSGKVTRYRKGDTLVANIRPYFKKIWYATDEGTCSGDVIVFRANDARYAPYVFFSLCRDEFFEYVMLGAKGTKMPRGDKKQMMTFPISTNCNSTDLQLLQELASTIGTNHAENGQLARLRDTLLPKLMSGEIDVSKVDLTQLNSHLAQIRIPKDTPLATTDLGFKFDRSHYSPLLHNPSSSQQQWATIWFLRITQCSFSNMQCVFRTYDETATPDIEFVAQCAMFLTHNYLLIRHGVEYVRQNDMLFVEHTRQKAERIPDP